MKSIIITADDYGMHDSVNKAIEEGIEAGLITSTNVMTGMPECHKAEKLRKLYPHVSLGLHWTLTTGKPVSAPESISSLIDDNGEFHTATTFRKRYRRGYISNSEIRTELIAQYKKFISICGEPDYWNTHQNIHVAFKLMQLFVELAKELKIKKMRSNQRIYVPSSNGVKWPIKRRSLEALKRIILSQWMENANKAGIVAPDGLIFPINEAKDKNGIEYLFSNIKWGNSSCAEHVIHPAKHADCKYFGDITTQRINEYRLYTSKHTLEVIKTAGLNLVSFSELHWWRRW